MTKVEWADETLSPWAGCTKISTGCAHCTALSFARRLQGQNHPKYKRVTKNGEWSGRVNFDANELDKLYRWKKPRRVFIQIMGDIAHEGVDIIQFSMTMNAIRENPRHTCMLLTKRPDKLKHDLDAYCSGLRIARLEAPLPNVWVGVTAENQEQVEKRIPILMETPAVKRFVSIEPMLGPIRLAGWLHGLDQVLLGAETGPGKRPMLLGWASDIAYDCESAGVAFFGKKDNNGDPLTIDGKVIREFAT